MNCVINRRDLRMDGMVTRHRNNPPLAPRLRLGRARMPVVAGSMATQFSAMNSRQAKIARSWMLARGPVGTSCGTSALMKLGGRVTWADADWTAGRTHSACETINKSEYALGGPLCPPLRPRACALNASPATQYSSAEDELYLWGGCVEDKLIRRERSRLRR